MLSRDQLLRPLAGHRTDQVVVTTMSVTRPWGCLSDHDLDFASADSAMGHAADLALGIALARPDRMVLCLNGDGSMLMTLGTLATVVGSGARNLVLFVVDNGTFEITGHQPVPGDGTVDYAAIARAAGFPRAFGYRDPEAFAEAVPGLVVTPGPTLVHVAAERGSEGPISRSPREEARYLRTSLADWSRAFRRSLAEASSPRSPGPLNEAPRR
ncbi:MAG TPA: thiamine pyrophosphate-dependent enzyme [Longimicrobiales bacterium]|nr:thiamine pyrophosphate-dependent enzyme [Longimicrobiales bacterium]